MLSPYHKIRLLLHNLLWTLSSFIKGFLPRLTYLFIYFILIIIWIQLTTITAIKIIIRLLLNYSHFFIILFFGWLSCQLILCFLLISKAHYAQALLTIYLFNLCCHLSLMFRWFGMQTFEIKSTFTCRSYVYDLYAFLFKIWFVVMDGWPDRFCCFSAHFCCWMGF